MSDFSHALQNLVEKYGGNTALQRATGVHNSVVSRLTSGDNEASPETLQKLCQNIPHDEAASLVWAWVSDVIPGSLRRYVRIEPTKPLRVLPPDPGLVEILSKLDSRVQSALQQFAEEALKNPDFGKCLRTQAEYTFPEWAKREDEKLTKELLEFVSKRPGLDSDEESSLPPIIEQASALRRQQGLGAVEGFGHLPEGLIVVEGKRKPRRKSHPRGPRKSK